MNVETLAHVDTALGQIISEYSNNYKIVFENDSSRRRFYNNEISKKLRSWNKSKTCMYRNCANKSTRRSHSVQKAGPLQEIAKASIVLTPEFNHATGKVELVRKSLTKASVFPGFCAKHEMLFFSFENVRAISAPEGMYWQIYRSICREIVRLRHQIYFTDKMISEYENLRDRSLKQLFELKLGASWMAANRVNVKTLNLSNDRLVNLIREKQKESISTLEELENEFLREIEDCLEITDLHKEGMLNPVSLSIDTKLPVVLSGIGSFYVIENGQPRQVLVILLVLPGFTNTTIVIHGKSTDTKHFHGYIRSKLSNSFDILNMIEQWMVRGTDHWFLNCDVWDQKSSAQKNRLLTEILDGTKGITHELDFSVFDEIRKCMIQKWKDGQPLSERDLEILRREQAKLDWDNSV